MRRVSRRAVLIAGHADFGALRLGQHRFRKVLSLGMVKPRGADDVRAGIVRGGGQFARQLALAVYRERRGTIEFVVRPIALAVEDVIGRDMNKRRAEFETGYRKVARPDGVEPVRPRVIGL